MANNLASNPIRIDSAMAGSFRNFLGPKYIPSSTGATSSTSFGRFKIAKIVWGGVAGTPIAAGDTFVVKDGDPAGNPFATNPASVIASDVLSATPAAPLVYPVDQEVMDFMVTTVPAHGYLQIYLAPID